MGYRLEYSVRIDAPAAVVWGTMQDFTRRTLWDMRVIRAELLTPPIWDLLEHNAGYASVTAQHGRILISVETTAHQYCRRVG